MNIIYPSLDDSLSSLEHCGKRCSLMAGIVDPQLPMLSARPRWALKPLLSLKTLAVSTAVGNSSAIDGRPFLLGGIWCVRLATVFLRFGLSRSQSISALRLLTKFSRELRDMMNKVQAISVKCTPTAFAASRRADFSGVTSNNRPIRQEPCRHQHRLSGSPWCCRVDDSW